MAQPSLLTGIDLASLDHKAHRASSEDVPVSFKVGDRVVYPHHGAAVIEKKEKRKVFGEEQDYLVLRMAHGEMTLAVPVDKAEEVGMRWPISTEDVEDLFDVLAKRDVREPANWSPAAWSNRARQRSTPRCATPLRGEVRGWALAGSWTVWRAARWPWASTSAGMSGGCACGAAS